MSEQPRPEFRLEIDGYSVRMFPAPAAEELTMCLVIRPWNSTVAKGAGDALANAMAQTEGGQFNVHVSPYLGMAFVSRKPLLH